MSEANNLWKELARRASESKFSGITPESDDLLGNAELREALLSPNAAAGGVPNAGMGMMPPMMMGGMGAGGRGGQAGATGGGLGGSTGMAAAGAAPSNYAPRPAGTLTSAQELKPDAPGGAAGGGGPVAAGADTPSAPGSAGDDASPAEQAVTPSDDAANRDGFTVEQEQLEELAALWAEMSETYERASNAMPAPVSLGFAEQVKVSTDDLASATERWGHEAAQEFLTISHAMVSSARAYAESEDAAVATARTQEG